MKITHYSQKSIDVQFSFIFRKKLVLPSGNEKGKKQTAKCAEKIPVATKGK